MGEMTVAHAVFQLGPLAVELAGRSDLVRALAEELNAPQIGQGSAAPDLRLRFGLDAAAPDERPTVEVAHRSRFPFTHVAEASTGMLAYALRPKAGTPLYRVGLPLPFNPPDRWDVSVEVAVPGPRVRRLLDAPARLLSRDYSPLMAVLAKNIIDEIIDPLVWLRLLLRDGVLAHGGAVVAPGGRGILLLGAGGTGKTRTGLHLVAESGWRFLGDDRTALFDGCLHRHPKRLRASASHLAAVVAGERTLLAPRPLADRATWAARKAVLGPAKVGRRIPPDELFGPSGVADIAPLGAVFLLRAVAEGSGPQVRPIAAEQLSQRAASMVCNQFWDALRSFSLLSAGSAATVPSLADLHAQTAAAFTANVTGVPLRVISVPPRTPWRTVAQAVVAEVG